MLRYAFGRTFFISFLWIFNTKNTPTHTHTRLQTKLPQNLSYWCNIEWKSLNNTFFSTDLLTSRRVYFIKIISFDNQNSPLKFTRCSFDYQGRQFCWKQVEKRIYKVLNRGKCNFFKNYGNSLESGKSWTWGIQSLFPDQKSILKGQFIL